MIEIQKRMETRLQENGKPRRRQLYDGLEAFWEGLRISRAVRQSLGFQLKVRLITISYSTVFFPTIRRFLPGPTRIPYHSDTDLGTIQLECLNIRQLFSMFNVQVHPIGSSRTHLLPNRWFGPHKNAKIFELYSNPMLWSLSHYLRSRINNMPNAQPILCIARLTVSVR